MDWPCAHEGGPRGPRRFRWRQPVLRRAFFGQPGRHVRAHSDRPVCSGPHSIDLAWLVVHRLPGALKERLEEIADEYADSNLLGTGQFCTNPGIVLVQVTRPSLQRMHPAPTQHHQYLARCILRFGEQPAAWWALALVLCRCFFLFFHIILLT